MMLEPAMASEQHGRHRCRLIKSLKATTEFVKLVSPADNGDCMIGGHERLH